MKTRDWFPPEAEDLLLYDFEMMQLLADGFQVALPRQARQEGLDAAVELVLVVELVGEEREGGGGVWVSASWWYINKYIEMTV